ncbi:MAG: cobalamin-binding protein [Gammaproteobacteria bacterium]|nr:cobalamin-binding protein [Gammaproteobacteria bacterium]
MIGAGKLLLAAGRGVFLAAVLPLATACSPGGPQPADLAAAAPVQRIVTLSPHLAELVFTAGAGGRLVGVVEFSDFPPEARRLPRIGDAFRVDYEAIAALRPELVLAWTSGNPPETLQRLQELGFRVVALEPARLDDIGVHIEQIGDLAGSGEAARQAARRYRVRLEQLRARAAEATPQSVFIQLAERPYFTVTDQHFLGQAVRLCGGQNIFGDLPGLTAIVSKESIIEAAPAVIIASDMGGAARLPLEAWQAWQGLPAVRNGRLYTLDADLLSRPSVRILDGIEQLCRLLDDRA